ncbi:queuine tRNA-ribosyltransferase family protein [Fluoribacter dumoffii]|uniref:tRNA-guanine transglycosylase n=1 Tax=Fluoribacter dumoffii TaxID=463 RepID=UPI002243FC8A|nr:tRNA-guanine transglycosylase [Fluoribacter dumoffii]MCW8418025.1 queuine tRNA-ribosyltransferase family protein [Fluoribacter dumoffii]MCW8454133.1 queuine tRNA-ribosyltransferase family protein [Fluoribacter dumoffii]MCW8461793.1 queuine tRNA-ribosyltransferase family protein [Fluoribacter dumoffii]MCW8482009.1 queuine tRNA-ribosyltransferase family protein [Fluoribacter dumoffii]
MLTPVQNFIPVLTSEAGLCLTTANWQEAKVTAASYSLEQLLYKPGQELLKSIDDLSHYLVCPGITVLNALSLRPNKEGVYVLKSPYDGSIIKFTSKVLIHLVQHLKPAAVILPANILQNFPEIWDNWNDEIIPFLHAQELKNQQLSQPHGVYFNVLDEVDWEQLERWSHLPRYVTGCFDAELVWRLGNKGIGFIETDEPAQAAMQGKVYSHAGDVDLTDSKTQMQFELIDADCVCPTCSQQFTRAYLHHLLQHTPLLCQRFLIQHNVYYVQNSKPSS